MPLTSKQTAESRFATIRVFTGRHQGGCEVVKFYEGLADRGLTLIDTEGEGKPYCGKRPRSMKFAAGMYSGDPKDWTR